MMEGGREEVRLPSDLECTCPPASRLLWLRVVSPHARARVCVSVRARVRFRLRARVCVHDQVYACVCLRDTYACNMCVCDVIVVVSE